MAAMITEKTVILFCPKGEIGDFLGRCKERLSFSIEAGCHMHTDFLLMVNTCEKVFIGSPATKIIGFLWNAGNKKFHLIVIAGKCYCRKEQGHALHS